ncbi:hypothetical protein TUM17382_22730 [Shewanella algae]|nr:hypothetical protein TUM17382_22730 [Shewanella algae]
MALAIAYSAGLSAATAARAINDFNNLTRYVEQCEAKRRNKSDRKRNRQNRWR